MHNNASNCWFAGAQGERKRLEKNVSASLGTQQGRFCESCKKQTDKARRRQQPRSIPAEGGRGRMGKLRTRQLIRYRLSLIDKTIVSYRVTMYVIACIIFTIDQ